ncbi:MAG: Mov34/MPN/PAD-1 family protein, partial [Nanoarchaeota archaeon]|nr:Mov34/MPN/PAD-1 family protein [Nanoarchaeota archaeon]
MIYNPYKKNIPEIKTIKVTQEAFEKMNFYSKKVSEIIGADYECLGYLLKDSKKKDQIVRDVILDQNQKVTVGEAEGRGFYDTKKPEGMDVMGVWHSHGYNLASHSGQDIKFLETMYQNGLYNNKISLGERKKDIECIVEGEITHIFEKYSNKEIRIKGKVNQLEYVEREDAYILNSILINRNSYLG